MRILIIKMSSMGDVFHVCPAVSDLIAAHPGATIDWIVEKSFAEIPAWHAAVNHVWPIDLRRWRKSFWSATTRAEVRAFFAQVNAHTYDYVIDAQGLLKSVWVARHINAPRIGMDRASVREKLASLFYQHKISVPIAMHAVQRLRLLFARAFDYPLELDSPLVYALDRLKPELPDGLGELPYVVFLHGTTWDTKYWPETHWLALAKQAQAAGLKVVLPWGNDEEQARSTRLAAKLDPALVWAPPERIALTKMAAMMRAAQGVVSVDTGLSHVAAALDVPMAVLYRVTNPERVGALGERVVHLVSPVAPEYVKRFSSSAQEKLSLENLSVDNVLAACPFLKAPLDIAPNQP